MRPQRTPRQPASASASPSVSASRWTRAWVALAALAVAPSWSCGEWPASGDSGDVAQRQSALRMPYNYPPAAAISVRHPSGVTKLWVFACDSQNRLRVIQRYQTWGSWQTLDTGCVGVPTVGKWSNGASDTLLVYVTRSDGHLWELWYPNPDGAGSWGNVSSSLGYGNIVGSPAIADSDGTGRVSVAARVGAELYTFDWYSGAWHARPVLWETTPVRSSSYMKSNYETSVTYLSGRANLPDGSADVGWVATRSSWATNFKVVTAGALDTVGVPGLGAGLGSTPTAWDPSVRVVQVRGGWLFASDPTSSSWEDSSLYGCAGPKGFTTNRRNPAAGATNHLYGSQGDLLLAVEANPGGYGGCRSYAESGTVASGVAPTIDGQTSIWPATSYGTFVFYTGGDGSLKAFDTATKVLTGLALLPLPQSD